MDSILGITKDEAESLLSRLGPNEITAASQRGVASIFISQFANVVTFLLLGAALLSFFLSDVIDGMFILLIIILNAVLGFVQEYRAEKALAALKKLAVAKTTVIRDGIEQEIDSRFLVPGDVIKIEEGDKVPADAKLLSTVHLGVNEASLTGESLPVFKKEHEEDHDSVYLGTIVVSGRAMACVEATGMRTRFGRIAKGLAEIQEEPTPLSQQLVLLGKQLGVFTLIASILVFIFGALGGREILSMFLTSVSLAVAAVPEGLPAVITITLAVGVHRMVRKRAIVRKMAAIETLGAATIIAADKTGTITKNEMRVREIFADGKRLDVRGDPSTSLRAGRLEVSKDSIGELLKIGVLANTASLVFKHDHGGFDIIGDPTEGALLLCAHEFGFSPSPMKEKGELLDEFSFDTTRKTMSVVWKENELVFAYVKGSPETILERSTRVLRAGKDTVLTDTVRKHIETAFQDAASRGFRVIAMARKPWHPIPGKIERDEVESDLTFVGFASLSDPPRPQVREAAQIAQIAGIKTIMITGDNEHTANAIAEEVGLISKGEDILTGKQLDELTEDELVRVLPNVRIFARTTPEHKLRIVRAYQRLGHVVAATGDGVNDALALRQANVGVAMGIAGTDVAKEASDLIVADDNYATIVKAVEEGRTIFDNIVKSVVYLASGNLGELLTILVAVIIGLPTPLLPVQILWINLVTDGLPALALAVDPKDPMVMRRQPRSRNAILGEHNVWFIGLVGTLIAATVLSFYTLALQTLDQVQARTIAFTTLIFLHVSVAFLVRKNHNIFSNRFLVISVLTVFILQGFILLVPLLHPIFKVSSLW